MLAAKNWQDDVIEINDRLVLHSVHERYTDELFELVIRNKAWLQKSMNWPQSVNAREDMLKTVEGNYLLHHRGITKMFPIFFDGRMVGICSFNQIEPTNKTAYIGYWLDERAQGKGIISQAVQALIAKYSAEGLVRRFVIKCIVTNAASNGVAQRNGFELEGCLRQAEFLNGKFHDQNIYAKIVERTK